ncbi:hypothetical protein [Amycolatopsis sp. DG1A-15b]|uniref:hypothetical protein n=1 Tax=Amycolatopsis sp. DG1A-15b TaxID=3052846 RepID=UPI00255C1048|nr:hypothetical protein [Amycolatopsis sp. DG1A-15b]WIX85812.1 hypothetical protein QRY02_31995 [Amycolatopsis sp. DG1A-15b]
MSTTEHGEQEFMRRCETIISALPIRHPFELRAFLDALGQQQGMSVILGRMPLRRGGVSGLLARTREECWLTVVAKAVPAHAAHIAFHEIGHWILGHPGNHACGRRTRPDDRWEVEAEQFACLLREHVKAGAARHRDRLPPGRTALRAAFGSRRHLCADA